MPEESANNFPSFDVPKRLTNSTEGRFTILDEQQKDSDSFDDDSDFENAEFPEFSQSEFFF